MKWFYVLILFVGVFVGCQHSQSQKTNQVVQASSWQEKMNVLAVELRELMPYIYSKEKFEDKAHFTDLSKSLHRFAETVRSVKSHPSSGYPEKDPSLLVTLSRMQSELDSSVESFDQKDFAFSRSTLKTVTQYCSYCHTRRESGTASSWLKDSIDLPGASGVEKADFFIATRQFERAKEELKSLFLGEQGNSFEKERAVKKFMVVGLRAMDDPKGTASAIEGYTKEESSSYYFKKLAKVWLNDLKNWAQVYKKQPGLKQIKAELDAADARKDFLYDESAAVVYLKMSKQLYDLLANEQSASDQAETFYLLGRTYEILRGVGLWDLNEVYYESCIRRLPHSVLAVQCYKSYEQSMVMGYSGSGGIFIPHNVRNQLVALKELAEPLRKEGQ